jgi:hypothetical protein
MSSILVTGALLEAGAVSSGALDEVTTYTLPEDVAAAVADAVEVVKLPLRRPIGTRCSLTGVDFLSWLDEHRC